MKVLVSASVECCYLFCMLEAGNLKYEVTNSLACLVINFLRLNFCEQYCHLYRNFGDTRL